MSMKIQVEKKDLFYTQLLYLDPILNLLVNERRILAALITLHYTHREKYDNPFVLNELLFMQETLNMLQQKLTLSKGSFEKAYKALLQKKCIIKEKLEQDSKEITQLNPALVQYPKDGKFRINIEFVLK